MPVESHSLSDDLLRRALLAVTDGVFLFDGQKVLTFANAQAEELQSNISRLKVGSRCCDMFWQAGEWGSCVVDRALDNGQRLEFELPASASFKTPVFITVQPIKGEGDHTSAGVLVMAKDIAALRRAEAEAIAQKSFMANLADRSPDEIYALDKVGRINWVNQRAETGNPMMLVGQRLVDFIGTDFKETITAAIERAAFGEQTQT